MPCFSPLHGYRAKTLNPSGKRSIVFKISEGFADQPLTVPCGRCRGCRLRKSEEWAIRSHCEASLNKNNSFITLTYDDKHLPSDGSINVRSFQLFMKKLRKENPQKTIRYLHCGEYGDKRDRPHYHAILYNHSFDDDKVYEEESNGFSLYSSPTLTRIWGMGRAIIGDVTFESSAYVARYVMKKITGDEAAEHYKGKKPEFNTMSRRNGIGTKWIEKYVTDVYPHDFIIVDGKKRQPPKFFDEYYKSIDPVGHFKLKVKRSTRTPEQLLETDSFRLLAKEMIAEAQYKKLLRKLHT